MPLSGAPPRYHSMHLSRRRDRASERSRRAFPRLAAGSLPFIVSGLVLAWTYYRLGFRRIFRISWTTNTVVLKPLLLLIAIEFGAIALTFLVARLLRPKTATVFISYPHEHLAVASALVDPLSTEDLQVRLIAFVDRPSAHNQVISEIVTNIRQADALVVVTAEASNAPGSPRFYKAEILAASVSHMPVVLLVAKRNSDYRQPLMKATQFSSFCP